LGDNVCPDPSPNTPSWVNHLAMRVDTIEQLELMKARLEAHDIDVLGVTDHRVFQSIYFFDPNGLRLELCAQLASNTQMFEEQKGIREKVIAWTLEKNERLAQKK